jgi:ADP-heptose:LPS heptosyltransferase
MRTLVIQFGRVGDVIQTTPLLADLVADSRNLTDVLLVAPNQTALARLGGLSQIRAMAPDARLLDDQIATGFAVGKVPPEASTFLSSLSLPRYDRVINASHSALGCWLAGHIPCERREGGVIGDSRECLYEGSAHTYRIAQLGFRHRNWFNLVDLLRCSAEPRTMPQPGSRPYVNTFERLSFTPPPGRKVALNVGASEPDRRWPQAHFASLAEGLTAAGLVPILVGAPSERDLAAQVQALCRCPLPSFMETPVPEMATLLSVTDLLVSVDTGAVHIAAAVGTKVLSLSASTVYFAETAPWAEGNLILQGQLGAPMAQLEPSLVLTAALNRLGLVDQASLRSELAHHQQEAWETAFLPVAADPLGGISYWPLHEYLPSIEDLFTRTLRHVFAASFCGGGGSISIEYLKERFPQAWDGPRSIMGQQAEGLLNAMKPITQTLQQMSIAAAKCEKNSRRIDRDAGAVVNNLVPVLIRTLKTLLKCTSNADSRAFQPVVHYLDWRLRVMPLLPPVETFAYHGREYRNAAAMLDRCWSLLVGSPPQLPA